jgi:TetR/AcrR family transcriptional regulator, ethionamide resistance regulator
MSGGSEPRRRRRRSPEVAEREIVDAAEALLRERPFRELTVDEVMRHTGLSRPSFYVYFSDRHQLVLKVVEHLGGELSTMSDRWVRGIGEPLTLAHEALEGIVAVFAQHGPVMRALADAATDDTSVEAAYAAVIQGFIDVVSGHIASEIEAGRILPLNPVQTATALVWMTERYLMLSLGREPLTPEDVVFDTLWTIWTRTLYGTGD